MPDRPGDPLPYGTEELENPDLKVKNKGGELAISVAISQWPRGFIATEADSKWVNGTLFLVYRNRYRAGFGGLGEQKEVLWRVKTPVGMPIGWRQEIRVLHKPDQVIQAVPPA